MSDERLAVKLPGLDLKNPVMLVLLALAKIRNMI